MSQQAHRPAPPGADTTTDLPEAVAADAMTDLPSPGGMDAMAGRPEAVATDARIRRPEPVATETFPPLTELLDAVRSPGMVRADIDALIAALGRPLPADESPRARADVLLYLMDRDNPLGHHRGRDRTTVRHAAKDALLSLGYPYALELPPELLETPARAHPVPSKPYTGPGAVGIAATLLSALYQSGVVAVAQLVMSFGHFDWERPWTEPFLPALLAVWIPTLSALFGHGLGNRTAHVVGSWGLWLLAAAWSVAALVGLSASQPFWLFVLPWHLALWSAWTMRPGPDPQAKPETPTEPRTPLAGA
ncbi:hypothetical protein G4177_28525 [Corallococcus sp. ZKHCc1 1396]|uniref:Uncharacterized protein n=1 Tax=Corallococcus soli TaxID=2710757 RepID=A0ABR9PW63_9BACT|nr:hypothetical protein [Corallococcus soli]MBE4752114.1 hypothetical protein [Corallococcus soli]